MYVKNKARGSPIIQPISKVELRVLYLFIFIIFSRRVSSEFFFFFNNNPIIKIRIHIFFLYVLRRKTMQSGRRRRHARQVLRWDGICSFLSFLQKRKTLLSSNENKSWRNNEPSPGTTFVPSAVATLRGRARVVVSLFPQTMLRPTSVWFVSLPVQRARRALRPTGTGLLSFANAADASCICP